MTEQGFNKHWEDLDERIRGWWDDDLHHSQETEVGNPSLQPAWSNDEIHVPKGPEQTLLFLPHPYISAGGSETAFPEMYCWDTFFINLALLAHRRFDIVRHHILNHLFMIQRHGFVPNGNRTYYLTRSQTPLLAESVRRYHRLCPDRDLLCLAYPSLKQEYLNYWNAQHHQTPTGLATNRDLGDPRLRPELAAEAEVTDFTACFGGDVRQCNPLQTNCVLVQYARNLAWMAAELGWEEEARSWRAEADRRDERIRDLCWDEEEGFYFEYHYVRQARLPFRSLGAYWALWSGTATIEQADRLARRLNLFEHVGGLSQTDEAYPSPHPEFRWVQWGYPAGWPPFHLMVVEGLDHYGYRAEAERIAEKFLALMTTWYQETGKLWEKYNVVDGSVNLPRERYGTPPLHGWSSAAVALLGRRLFKPAEYSSEHP